MQSDRGNFTPVQQTLTVSENEARMGTSREIMLPSGERLSIFIPPGTFSGKVIPVERPGMPPVLVTVNVSSAMAPPPPPPLEKTQLASPQGSGPQGQWNAGQAPGANAQTQWGSGPNAQSQWNQGQVQGANAQTQWGQGPGSIPPVPMGQGPGTPPPARPNRTRTFVLIGIALLIIIVAVIGIFTFTTVQHNQQVSATATAHIQTQVVQNNLNGTATQTSAIATATQGALNATATAANTFPDVAGNYTGTLTNTANAGKQFALTLALQQNQQSLTGTCSLDASPFPIQNGTVTLSGHVSFSISIPGSGGSSATQVNFVGAQQSNGSLSGTWTSTTGGQGPWSATKS